MRVRGVIKAFLSLYLWSFIVYQITPVKIVPRLDRASSDLSPKPFVNTYSFALGVKTAFSNHAGSIKSLQETAEKRRFDFIFGDFPQRIGGRLLPAPEETSCLPIRISQVSVPRTLLHFLLETLPKSLVGARPEGFLSRGEFEPSRCYALVHDANILFTTSLGLQLPTYESVLGEGKNLLFSREAITEPPSKEASLVLLGEGSVSVFGFSDKSFYLPGERTGYPFRYFLETELENPLILLFRDGSLKGVFSQKRINVEVREKGSYTSQVLTYRFKIGFIYFGVRTKALVSSIELM